MSKSKSKSTSKSFDITNHVDYDKHFAGYIKRSECDHMLKAQRPCKITKHPKYKTMQKQLKEKYAIKDTSTCPPTYKECNVEGHPRFVSQANTITKLKKQLEAHKNISSHPQYQAMQRVLRSLKRKNEKLRSSGQTKSVMEKSIMEKYACKDTSTCPPTYKKCDKTGCRKVETHPKYIKLQKKLARALAQSKSQTQTQTQSPELASVKDHPMFLEMKRGYKREIAQLEQKIALLKEFEIKFKSHKCRVCPVQEQCTGISEERYDELYRKYASQGEEVARLRSKNADALAQNAEMKIQKAQAKKTETQAMKTETQSKKAIVHKKQDNVWFADNQQPQNAGIPVPYPYPGFWN